MKAFPRLAVPASVGWGSLAAVLAIATTAVVLLASNASGHILLTSAAVKRADAHAQALVNDGTYVSFVRTCTRLYPHIFSCRLQFDTVASKPTDRYACVEYVTPFFRAPHEGRGQSYTVFFDHKPGSRICD